MKIPINIVLIVPGFAGNHRVYGNLKNLTGFGQNQEIGPEPELPGNWSDKQ
jgi:hypothetical protein